MHTKKGKKNKHKLIRKGNGNEPTVIEFNLSKAVITIIAIVVIILGITVKHIITTVISVKTDSYLVENEEENVTWVTTTEADGTTKRVPVPKGYTASQIEGETTVNGGFVIYEDNYNGKSINWDEILVDSSYNNNRSYS